MTLHLHWFLPAHGDGRSLSRRPGEGVRRAQRPPDVDYLTQVALASEKVGFDGILVPTGLFCEDPWLLTAALAASTSRLRFMVALRPGLMSPTLAAQMAATAQRITAGRLMLNVVCGSDMEEQHRYGDWADHSERYERAAEFLEVMHGAWSGSPISLKGKHVRVVGARTVRPPRPRPTVFLGGSSAQARDVAAQHADVYLAWGERPDDVFRLGAQAQSEARERGRSLTFGTRYHVITRDTAEAAWAEAEALLGELDPEMVRQAQERFRTADSEGQRRVASIFDGRDLRQLELAPNIWAGFGLLRQGPSAALVGSHDEVADRIEEMYHAGVEHLILSGQPHLEEAYWFGEGVIPRLRDRGLLTDEVS